MYPEELRYDQETATRYSDPPSNRTFESSQHLLFKHYAELTHLRNTAKTRHRALVEQGVFQSIPTLTSEHRNGRPGTFWRAVFKTNSPEVLHGLPRKHYIGSDPTALDHWQQWIHRTRLAMTLSSLIDEIGRSLKAHSRTIHASANTMASLLRTYNQRLENIQ